MKAEEFSEKRPLNQIELHADLVVVGGGLSGICTSITAARQGIKVLLVQDRPVLGGNASSEVRLWVLGATSHMGNNNRWSREGGVIDEILVENTFRNPEGNPMIFDLILLDKVKQEPNIQLLLNTAVYDLYKKDADTISSITAFCSQNSTSYKLSAPLFCDASGDGILGFLSGAAFRMGAESQEEFGEKMAPDEEYGSLLGHSLYFYSKDAGKPIQFIPPSFALQDIREIPRYRSFNAKEFGCKLWWVEYGGRLDTVHDTEQIKWELWKVVYGIWNHIKNSGDFPEAENLTLEWVGTIPGKRESRRFEGEYIMIQQDLVEQRKHEDAIAYGGWSIDLHPADGVYSERPGCNQWHTKGIFQIPYRSLYSRNIGNLFLTGRIISVSHVAFGATRVMATSAYVGQAAGMAAAMCSSKKLLPAQIISEGQIGSLQQQLLENGQYIPGLKVTGEHDLVMKAKISASSELQFLGFAAEGSWKTLALPSAQLFPLQSGPVPVFHLEVNVLEDTILMARLRGTQRSGNFTPDLELGAQQVSLKKGLHTLRLDFDAVLTEPGYVFLQFDANPNLQLGTTEKRVTGILSVFNTVNKAVSNFGKQSPTEDSGVDTFEFWCPQRRPNGQNLCVLAEEMPKELFAAENVSNGTDRPTLAPNAWVASWDDPAPELQLEWDSPQDISRIDIWLDTDFDHPMESVLMGHPERVMPFCVRDYQILDEAGNTLYIQKGNYQSRSSIHFDKPVHTRKIFIQVQHPSVHVPAAIFAVRCYS